MNATLTAAIEMFNRFVLEGDDPIKAAFWVSFEYDVTRADIYRAIGFSEIL